MLLGENMKIKCPKCGSKNVGQYRQMTGPIWCEKCGYRVEQKELGDSGFFVKEASDVPKCNGSCKCCCKK